MCGCCFASPKKDEELLDVCTQITDGPKTRNHDFKYRVNLGVCCPTQDHIRFLLNVTSRGRHHHHVQKCKDENNTDRKRWGRVVVVVRNRICAFASFPPPSTPAALEAFAGRVERVLSETCSHSSCRCRVCQSRSCTQNDATVLRAALAPPSRRSVQRGEIVFRQRNRCVRSGATVRRVCDCSGCSCSSSGGGFGLR